MDWSISFDATKRLMTCVTRGLFSTEEHGRMVKEILGDPEWRPGMDALFDHRALDFGDAGFKEMFEASGSHRSHDGEIGSGKAALVMESTAAFGIARTFTNILEGQVEARLNVFKDMDAASAWLSGDRDTGSAEDNP